MIGLRFNLRLYRWYDGARGLLFAGAILVPVLALLGFALGAREIAAAAEAPPMPPVVAGAALVLDRWHLSMVAIMATALLGVLAARVARRQWQWRAGSVLLTYPDGRRIKIMRGTSILEASREARIPHASICGGRGRCSTCRVRIHGPSDGIPDPLPHEIEVLRAIGAPPNVRLACQLRPTGNLTVSPLLPPQISVHDKIPGKADYAGSEREIAVMFCDLRGFTRLAEHMLPYDVVFLLNRYFAEMGRAIEEAGGRVDKFIGDGIMALFGLESDPETGARAALKAARAMDARLVDLNRQVGGNLDQPLRIGIGIHAGPAIVGEMGWGPAVGLTAIGDMVNTASRLETMTKDLGVQLVVSEAVARYAGLDLSRFPHQSLAIRGKSVPLGVYAVALAGDLPV